MYKIMIVDTYYPDFLADFYRKNDTAEKQYAPHLEALLDQFFGTADFYSRNLRALGYQAQDIIFNDARLQHKWREEHGRGKRFGLLPDCEFARKAANKLPVFPWQWQDLYVTLKAQIDYYQPDILYVQDIGALNDRFLAQLKPRVKLIAGQIACPLPAGRDLKAYDVIFTSFPHYVDMFRKMGLNAEYLKIGFEPRVWDDFSCQPSPRKYDCVFIGGFKKPHTQRVRLLEQAAERLKLDVWGYAADRLPSFSALKRAFHGEAWGREMYQVLGQSKISVNIHIDAAGDHANNMRLYESTGMGALLITDNKKNLKDLFSVGSEVIAYDTAEELCAAVEYYLAHEKEREAIAAAGQRRTLREHRYSDRMGELADFFKRYLGKR